MGKEQISSKQDSGKEVFLALPLLFLVLAQLGTSGDNAVLNVATKPIMDSLGASVADMQLANMLYSLCAGCFMVVGGMMGIIIGWNKNFKIGAALCLAGEVVLATATNISLFTWVGRSLVGIGGSILIPSVLGLVVALFKGKNRAIAFGFIGAATGLSMVAPLVAGFIIDKMGWRAAFWAMAAYFAVVLMGALVIPKTKKSGGLKMDYIGAILASLGLFMVLIATSRISKWGLVKPLSDFKIFGISPALPLIISGLIVLVGLMKYEAYREKQEGSALLPKSFFAVPQARSGLTLNAIIFFTGGGVNMVMIPYLQIVGGFSPTQTGLLLLVMAIPMFISSIIIPKYLGNLSVKLTVLWSILLTGAGIILMAFSLTPAGINLPLYIISNATFGFMVGIIACHASNVIAQAIEDRDAQQSGGVQATSRNVGQAIAIAFIGMIVLFSLPMTFKHISKGADITAESRQAVESIEILRFNNDARVRAELEKTITNTEDLDKLIDVNADARLLSSRIALITLGALVMAASVTSKNIPHKLY